MGVKKKIAKKVGKVLVIQKVVVPLHSLDSHNGAFKP